MPFFATISNLFCTFAHDMKWQRLCSVFFFLLAAITTWASGRGDTILLDMRSGLSESRVRCIRQMPDGRMAIATTTTIDIFDGTHFTAYHLPPEEYYPLPEYMDNRQMNCDTTGIIWLIGKQKLYVVDSNRKPDDHNPLRRNDIARLMRQRGISNQQIARMKRAPEPPPPITWEGVFQDMTVTAHTPDIYGALWIGTFDYGILYINPQRSRKFQTTKRPFPYEPRPQFCSPRASQLMTRHAPASTNCSYEEGKRYLYLGTLDGLLVFNSHDSIVTRITEEDGLKCNNVTAICPDQRERIWVTTAHGGISCVSVVGRDSFDIANYGLLDGIDLEGREFQMCSLHYNDKDDLMTAGFAGGIITFHPDSAATIRQYIFHHNPNIQPTKVETVATGATDKNHSPSWWWLLAVATVIASGFVLWLRKKNSKGKIGEAPPAPVDEQAVAVQQVKAQPSTVQAIAPSEETVEMLKNEKSESFKLDEQFRQKLQQVVEQNLGNEDFSVQQLSEQMAMDRSVLYRRMQVLNLDTPANYIKRIRMEVAARLLRETDLPINEIAMRTGFSNAKYFSVTFKQEFGKSPKDYREKGES